jgi:hypothetical protein
MCFSPNFSTANLICDTTSYRIIYGSLAPSCSVPDVIVTVVFRNVDIDHRTHDVLTLGVVGLGVTPVGDTA